MGRAKSKINVKEVKEKCKKEGRQKDKQTPILNVNWNVD